MLLRRKIAAKSTGNKKSFACGGKAQAPNCFG